MLIREKNKPYLIKLGKRLKAFRLKKEYSIIQFSFETGIARSNISKIENGTVSVTIETLLAISDVLDIPLKELFDF